MDDRCFEETLRGLAVRHPGQVGFEEHTAQRTFAGRDLVLMPSRFELCGFCPRVCKAYGSLPIVRCSGGLSGTAEGSATGFFVAETSTVGYAGAIRRALGTSVQKKQFTAMRCSAMAYRSGWDGAAKSYAALYRRGDRQ